MPALALSVSAVEDSHLTHHQPVPPGQPSRHGPLFCLCSLGHCWLPKGMYVILCDVVLNFVARRLAAALEVTYVFCWSQLPREGSILSSPSSDDKPERVLLVNLGEGGSGSAVDVNTRLPVTVSTTHSTMCHGYGMYVCMCLVFQLVTLFVSTMFYSVGQAIRLQG